MAPVVRLLAATPAVRSIVCSTGQHREMLDQVFTEFSITPDFDLKVMTPDQSLGGVTSKIIEGLEPIVANTKPDWVLAQGDTTTVLCAALVSYYRRTKFGHVEAGLRTGLKFSPFPEEMNRRVADVLSDICFAPTSHARDCLLSEGRSPETIFVTGNTVVDAVIEIAGRPMPPDVVDLIAREKLTKYVLVTAHRRESFGGPFIELCRAIRHLAERAADYGIKFVFPVHLNPNVRKPVEEILGGVPSVVLVEPLKYPSLVHLLKGALLVLTDSGGIQEEAPAFHVPVLIMRDSTERPEGLRAGVSKLVGTSFDRITKEAWLLMFDPVERSRMAAVTNPFGDGRASRRIVDVLLENNN